MFSNFLSKTKWNGIGEAMFGDVVGRELHFSKLVFAVI